MIKHLDGSTFYSHSKAETIINESDIDDAFKSSISNIQIFLEKGSGCIIDLVIDQSTIP